MNAPEFAELVSSIREAGAIRRGRRKASRTFDPPSPDVKRTRKRLGLSQPEFAAMIGVSVATLRNWEQGRRTPRGPARALLTVASKSPEAVARALLG